MQMYLYEIEYAIRPTTTTDWLSQKSTVIGEDDARTAVTSLILHLSKRRQEFRLVSVDRIRKIDYMPWTDS